MLRRIYRRIGAFGGPGGRRGEPRGSQPGMAKERLRPEDNPADRVWDVLLVTGAAYKQF